jgi:hypothetical protein
MIDASKKIGKNKKIPRSLTLAIYYTTKKLQWRCTDSVKYLIKNHQFIMSY